MHSIKNVAVFGAGGNFGRPITAALVAANFNVTIISRADSPSTFPPAIPVIKTAYAVPQLTAALRGQHAVVCAVGPAGIPSQVEMLEAAAAAGVRRFVVDDFGYPPGFQRLPELDATGESRRVVLERAAAVAGRCPEFSWSAVAIAVPIDWALKRFPTFGFDVEKREAIIYDDGTELFTGTTLKGIAQSVVGILQNPERSVNRHVCVRSIETCQKDILKEFEKATGQEWTIRTDTSEALLARGREKRAKGEKGWILDLLVGQLLEYGTGRGIVVSHADSDNELLGVEEESVADLVKGILG